MNYKFTLAILSVFCLYFSCVDSIEPEFDFQNNVIFVDAFVMTEPGISSVSVRKSVVFGDEYMIENVANARVAVKEVNSGDEVVFEQDSSGLYVCPVDFASPTSASWQLFIDLEDGRRFESRPEAVSDIIPFDNVEAEFTENARFDVNLNRYLQGHKIKVDWQDPADTDNYYLWKYRTFEPIQICKTCPEGIWRNGVCTFEQRPFWQPKYTNYICESPCWQIRYADEIPIFSDQFSNGDRITNREIASVPYYRDRDILVEVQQLSISASAYKYFKTINDLVSASSGLNAPPPAALLGNLYSPDNEEDLILGQFVVAAVASQRLFVDRSDLPVGPIEESLPVIVEDCFNCPQTFPCYNSFTRTNEKPEGWPE